MQNDVRYPSIYDIVHCVWNDWIYDKCSKSCGTGTRNKTRTEKIAAAHGGDPCDGVASDVETCTVQECPGCRKISSFPPLMHLLHLTSRPISTYH